MGDRHLLFYKPYGVLTQFTDERSGLQRTTLGDFIPVKGVYPVGRLDQDSEGLVLLTSNGRIQHQLSDPAFGHPRIYWVQVERIPDDDAIEHLRRGVTLKNYVTRPAQVRVLEADPPLPPREPPIRYRKSVPTAWLEMTLTEGRNRQVRRMTAAVGFPTLRLVRVAIAHLQINGMTPGQWRELTPDEVARLVTSPKHRRSNFSKHWKKSQ